MEDLLSRIENVPIEQQRELLALASKIAEKEQVEAARSSFLAFVQYMMPTFVEGRHHRIMAKEFDAMIADENDRLLVTLGPRHSKSLMTSVYFIAYYFGHHPDHQVIQATHNADLAQDFGRDVRNMVSTERYRKVFPDTDLQPDTKAAGRWNTTKGGKYFAIGVGGKLAGKGANCAYFSCKALTRRGNVPISQVSVGEEVLGYDHESGNLRWTAVRAVSTQRKSALVGIDGLWCTPEHRVFTESGYKRIDEADSVALLPVREGVLSRQEGSDALPDEIRPEKESPVLLFRQVLACAEPASNVQMRSQNTTGSQHLQKVLLEGQACNAEVSPVRENVFPHQIGARKERPQARRGRQFLLWQGLLRSVFRSAAKANIKAHRALQKVRQAYLRQQDILRHGLLRQACSEGGGILWPMGFCQEGREGSVPGYLRSLWKNSAKDGGTPHRPSGEPQPREQRSAAMRGLPQPLSSSDHGTCADDFAELLQGEGYRVVDIQTGTGNFFCEGKLVHNCLVIDDASSEQDYIRSLGGDTSSFDDTYEWYQTGPRQRLQPRAKICVVGTRWHVRDLMGRLIQRMTSNPKADQWKLIEFPAILPSGKPLWPEFWTLEELERTKAELSSQQWEAQYQQSPVSETAAIIKRGWWQLWPHKEPPKCEYVIQSWDTAYLKPDNRAKKRRKPDYSARTDWGIFYTDNDDGIREPNIILLDAWKKQVEFPQLKIEAKKAYDEVKPDVLLVEAKASGTPLVQELRMAGIPATDVGQSRGSRANPNDKISRVNNVADIFKQGKVWRPERKFAEDVVEECAAFPSGDFDDYVDTMTQAIQRFRQGGFISLKTDEDDDDWFPKKKADYY